MRFKIKVNYAAAVVMLMALVSSGKSSQGELAAVNNSHLDLGRTPIRVAMNFVSRPSTKIDEPTKVKVRQMIVSIYERGRLHPDHRQRLIQEISFIQTKAGTNGEVLEEVFLPYLEDWDNARRKSVVIKDLLANDAIRILRLPIEERVGDDAREKRNAIARRIGWNPDVMDVAAADYLGILRAAVDGIMDYWTQFIGAKKDIEEIEKQRRGDD